MKKENNAIAITSIISGVVLVIALVALMTFSSMSPVTKDTINVNGMATINANPDLMYVYFSIETSGENASEARDSNSEIYENLVSEIIASGFSEDDLKTQNFNVYPNKYWDDGKEVQEGYKAIHSLRIELSEENFEKVGNVVDAGINAGAGISYISFELSPELESQYKAQALEMAAKDAKTKAEAVASGFDKKVDELVSAGINEFGYSPWVAYASDAESSTGIESVREAASQIQPGEREINARVTAVYSIK